MSDIDILEWSCFCSFLHFTFVKYNTIPWCHHSTFLSSDFLKGSYFIYILNSFVTAFIVSGLALIIYSGHCQIILSISLVLNSPCPVDIITHPVSRHLWSICNKILFWDKAINLILISQLGGPGGFYWCSHHLDLLLSL